MWSKETCYERSELSWGVQGEGPIDVWRKDAVSRDGNASLKVSWSEELIDITYAIPQD